MQWRGKKIAVISLGIGKIEALSLEARQALLDAELLIGSAHHFNEIAPLNTTAQKQYYPSPLSGLDQLLDQNKRIAILASGDALFYGIGSFLIRLVGRENLNFFVNVSSIAAAFHAIGMPWQKANVVSLHGRPLNNLRRHLTPNALLALIPDQVSHPVAIAKELMELGFGDSTVWVCEALGGDREAVHQSIAYDLATSNLVFDPLNVCIVSVLGHNLQLPTFPGIPDQHFSTGAKPGFGMISKREVRLGILSMMQPAANEIAWDIGAGCGSVSVEWARWNSSGKVYAVESNPNRLEHLKINRTRFGVESNCHIIDGTAPVCCDDLPDPHCVFIGGSGGALQEILDMAWRRLLVGGKLVISAVTGESQTLIQQFMHQQTSCGIECEWSSIAVSKNLPDRLESRALEPVQLLKCIKRQAINNKTT